MTTRIARDLRRATGLHCAACHVPVHSSGLAVRYQDALCGVTPDSVHTLDPRRVEVGPTTMLLSVSQPGALFVIFASREAREAYLAMYRYRYSYVVEWDDVNGAGLIATIERVRGGDQFIWLLPDYDDYAAESDVSTCAYCGYPVNEFTDEVWATTPTHLDHARCVPVLERA